MSFNFSCVSSVMCASGRAWRKRSSAGVDITASPSQLTPRTRIRWGGLVAISPRSSNRIPVHEGIGGFILRCPPEGFLFARRLPAVMHPEPVRRIAQDCLLERAIHVQHDVLRPARLAVFHGRNRVPHFDPPLAEAGAKTNRRVQGQFIT